MAAGLYGKVPGFGDFLHRGLPSSFVEPWNSWLGQALGHSRTTLGVQWMNAYLTSPPWRFVLEPGLVGEDGWLGVLVSSVDRVGRCYPITLAIGLPETLRLAGLTVAIDPLLETLEQVSLRLIDGVSTPESVMGELDGIARSARPAIVAGTVLGRGGPERLLLGRPYLRVADLATRWLFEAGLGLDEIYPLSAWWHEGWGGQTPAGLVTPGLPEPEIFASFLDGRWSTRAWTDLDDLVHGP